MKRSKVVPLRLPEKLDELAALCAQTQHTDKATALRQWLYQGATHSMLELVAEGRLSIGRAAEWLDLTVYDLHRLAEIQAIELGASIEQRQRSRELAAKLIQGGRPDRASSN